jgi:imidazolonepropionase-like amidohydrolase
MDALVSATGNSATTCGVMDRGTLEPAKVADFMALDGSPQLRAV